jgi:predicted XRE-type DNA-binding protein
MSITQRDERAAHRQLPDPAGYPLTSRVRNAIVRAEDQETRSKKIGTDIRHMTRAGTNLFAEPGLAPDEANRYQAESRAVIDHALELKVQLMGELAGRIKQEGLKQAEAAEILRVTRPRVSDVVNGNTGKFTLDALVGMLVRAGKPVKMVVG